jgi:hypothetical protein
MKKMVVIKHKKELQELNASESTIQLILNNILLYNDLVDKYNAGNSTNDYLLYQLNNQILKQTDNVRRVYLKMQEKEDEVKPVEDAFTSLKKNIERR